MITFQNWPLVASFTFYISAKLINLLFAMIRQRTLCSIPEKSEAAEEDGLKWVPKKKHEVLKAKYKCLKKLFQIYDANIIGAVEPVEEHVDDTRTKRRRKRSHRTKTDACAGTSELSGGDIVKSVSVMYDYPKESETDVSIHSKTNKSCSTQRIGSDSGIVGDALETRMSCKFEKYAESNDSKESLSIGRECPVLNYMPKHQSPYYLNRKPTRFQIFVQRLFGLRRDSSYMMPNDGYAASDSIRHRRRGLRYRRIRRAKKIRSEGDLNLQRPAILSFVQSVQRNCLMDTTPRHCPMTGCKMVSYGIINYNDHLNLCHFKDKKFNCHYCHEGFEKEIEKSVHENEHIGLNKLNLSPSPSANQASSCNTQTEPDVSNDEKIKKIVSFFDRLTVEDVAKLKKDRCSETNLFGNGETDTESTSADSKRTASCMNIKSKCESSLCSSEARERRYGGGSPVACHYCGETFNFRKQLSLHIDLEHRNHEKFAKYHSCMGIVRTPSYCEGYRRYETPAELDIGVKHRSLVSEDGTINVLRMANSRVESCYSETASVTQTQSNETITQAKSEESLSCDPSTNIVYTGPTRSSFTDSLMKMTHPYKWEPGTKVIRV